MVVSVSDITERKQVEAELERRAAEIELKNHLLEQSARNKSEFLARMSHELCTPLNAIIGLAFLLRQTPPGTDGSASRIATDIEASGREMLALVNDMLELAKIESGKTEPEEHGGRVAVQSEPGKSGTFTLRPPFRPITPSGDDVSSGEMSRAPENDDSRHRA